MPHLPLFALALLAAAPNAPSIVGSATTFAAYQQNPAETQFNRLGSDMMAVVQRALSAPTDAEAIAILEKEGAPLRERAQQLRPTYAQWMAGRSPRETAGVRARLQNSSFATYFGTLETDPQLNNRLRGNSKLNQAVKSLLNTLDMRAK
ncbi:hypothetical protein MUN82_19515 [Hymenobacter aerilatus]|uniref:Uncharacterized protein n=1 Tax=Hymenobacter aerilatus TaxID=2932251 RepID=A0A8T9SSL4_9BACT|nr:hypothetical protein [Hymenobacter aerilatus]UOR05112.1 hypothetical protein MUN82_19515 [Hymenobacter aerilatus]